ncbi:hypothetical protein [Streptomyces sp. NPDC058579]|uniref:hypothetical protein n=1 Tax=Streptomyces sp. NPDC058579 TaxID=3346548 RepID=UPI003652F7A8
MPSSFDADADAVMTATSMLRSFTTHIEGMKQRFRNGVNDTITWYGTGEDEFAKKQGPIYLETVDNTFKTLDALTEAFLSLANGTMENANVFLNRQSDVLSSIKQESDSQSGPRG